MGWDDDDIFSDKDSFSDSESHLSNNSNNNLDQIELPFYLKTPIGKKITKHVKDNKLFDDENNLSTNMQDSDETDRENSLPIPAEDTSIIDIQSNLDNLVLVPKQDTDTVFSSDDDDNKDESDENDPIFQYPTEEFYIIFMQESEAVKSGGKIKLNFIHSLLSMVDNKYRNEEAHLHIINFKYWKNNLARKIFDIFNKTVFFNKLPVDTKIVFSKRLLKTGGTCQYFPNKTIQINISDKVCTNAERLLTVIIHEMCHGAVFIINKANDNHGPLWKAWCRLAKDAYPLVPMSTRCHNYIVHTKYQYRCEYCGLIKTRHSKSKQQTCSACGYNLIAYSDGGYGVHLKVDPNKPLSGFAAFVKEHYKSIRDSHTNHNETMKMLSKKFHQEQVQKALNGLK